MLRVQRERMSHAGGGFFPSPLEYHRAFGLDAERMAVLGSDALIMHPGPMNRGVEIACDFCQQKYVFDEEDVKTLFGSDVSAAVRHELKQ